MKPEASIPMTETSRPEPEVLRPDLCIIGAGSGGLTAAAVAVQLGASVVLIERKLMGGDCLNYGCVPSKALLAAAKSAQSFRSAGAFGIAASEPKIDGRRLHDHVQDVIAAIRPNDSVERFTGLGVRVIQAEAKFIGRRTVMAGDIEIRARRFVIATGSSPAVPDIPGIETVPYLTNETVFGLKERPRHLLIIGGGPIGMEMAQAHIRLGSAVTVLEAGAPLPKDDPEAAAIVISRLEEEGVIILADAKIERVERFDADIAVHVVRADKTTTIVGSHLLVAAGRKPGVEGLGLDKARIRYDDKGVRVGHNLKTRNGRVYAIGDAAGGPNFTHMASHHAGLVVRNALFGLPVDKAKAVVPWVTYTTPELAQVGLTEAEARKAHRKLTILRWPFSENDRAQAERTTEGFVKAVMTPDGRILGATLVGPSAGELSHLWVLAIAKRLKITDLADVILPYPTLGEVSKRAAVSWYLPSLTNPWLKRVMRFVRLFG